MEIKTHLPSSSLDLCCFNTEDNPLAHGCMGQMVSVSSSRIQFHSFLTMGMWGLALGGEPTDGQKQQSPLPRKCAWRAAQAPDMSQFQLNISDQVIPWNTPVSSRGDTWTQSGMTSKWTALDSIIMQIPHTCTEFCCLQMACTLTLSFSGPRMFTEDAIGLSLLYIQSLSPREGEATFPDCFLTSKSEFSLWCLTHLCNKGKRLASVFYLIVFLH